MLLSTLLIFYFTSRSKLKLSDFVFETRVQDAFVKHFSILFVSKNVCRRYQPFFDDVLPITIAWFETRHGHQEKMKKIIEEAAKQREYFFNSILILYDFVDVKRVSINHFSIIRN